MRSGTVPSERLTLGMRSKLNPYTGRIEPRNMEPVKKKGAVLYAFVKNMAHHIARLAVTASGCSR